VRKAAGRRSPLLNQIHYLMENSLHYLVAEAAPSSHHCATIPMIEKAKNRMIAYCRSAMASPPPSGG
jgi:hypothetical protein